MRRRVREPPAPKGTGRRGSPEVEERVHEGSATTATAQPATALGHRKGTRTEYRKGGCPACMRTRQGGDLCHAVRPLSRIHTATWNGHA